MNRFIYLITLITFFGVQGINAQIESGADLRKAIERTKTLHSFNIWQLKKVRGEDKAMLTLNAIEYSALNIPGQTFAVQFDLNLESGSVNDPTNHFTKRHYMYIDESEYTEVMVALKDIIKDYKARKKETKYGAIQYVTLDGIKLGFEYSIEKNVAYIEYNLNGKIFRGEFQYPDKIFELIHEQLNISGQKLYLPENEEKMKNAKKSKQDSKDVIIDDI